MIQLNGMITVNHDGGLITFDDLEVELLDRVEYSSFYKCTGYDASGNQYEATIEKCCGEYEEISDIEQIN